MKIDLSKQSGYTLVEVITVIGLFALVVVSVTLSMFTFRNNVSYDILLNQIVDTIHQAKIKAMSAQEDSSGSRNSYGVKFFEDRFVLFEGDTYVEGLDSNTEYIVSAGLRLTSSCAPTDDGTVVFSLVKGKTTNICTINIYLAEEATPTGTIVVNKYGVVSAS